MPGALVLVIHFIFVVFFAQKVQMLLGGEIISGITWAMFKTLTTANGPEVYAVVLRVGLTTYVNLRWAIGGFIASGVLRGLLELPSSWVCRNASEIIHGTPPDLAASYLTYGGDAYGNATHDPFVTHYFE